VRHSAEELSGRNNENERSPRNGGKAERIRGSAHEDLRGDGTACFFLMIDDWTRSMRPYGVVAVMAGQMHMKRLSVMVFVFLGVEMHVHQRCADGTSLHEHDEDGRGQPAEH